MLLGSDTAARGRGTERLGSVLDVGSIPFKTLLIVGIIASASLLTPQSPHATCVDAVPSSVFLVHLALDAQRLR